MAETSIFFQWLQDEAKKRGITIQEVLDDERRIARTIPHPSEICIGVLSYKDDLVRLGCRVVTVAPIVVEVPVLPEYLREHGEHILTCDFCRGLIHLASLRQSSQTTMPTE